MIRAAVKLDTYSYVFCAKYFLIYINLANTIKKEDNKVDLKIFNSYNSYNLKYGKINSYLHSI